MVKNIISRVLYAAVFISNMICIVAFIFDPASYTYSYGVEGSVGAVAAIQGLGVAFAMWNTTYPFYIFRKKLDPTLGLVIIVQQVVGLAGELIIQAGLDGEATAVMSDSITRFVWFDAGGLVLLIVGYILCRRFLCQRN